MKLEKGLEDVILKVLNREVFRSKGDEVAIDVNWVHC